MSATAYLVLASDAPPALAAHVAAARTRLDRAGWRHVVDYPLLKVFLGPFSQLQVTPSHDGHGVLLGDVFDRSYRRLTEDERRGLVRTRLSAEAVTALMTTVWGRYIALRTETRFAVACRDPSGSLDLVGWPSGALRVFTNSADSALDDVLPAGMAIDETRLAEIAAAPGEHHHALALTRVTPTAAGARLLIADGVAQTQQIWKPADVYRDRPPTRDDALARDTVIQTVRALAGDRPMLAELSGGFDSAVVGACLTTDQKGSVAQWVNHYTDTAEGDERAYARRVAARLGVGLTEVRRTSLGIDLETLAGAVESFRPPVNDLDPGYNADIAVRVAETGAKATLTGQGGDAVFFQMATPAIGLDEMFERGLRTRPMVLSRTARWCRTSAWPQTWWRAWRTRRGPFDWSHPWLADLRSVPPAKAIQMNALAYSQVFQEPARRSEQADCLNPLLAQPVMELGLGTSAADLTWMGRDRAMARRLFADRLPACLIARRSKGDVGAFYGAALEPHLPHLKGLMMDGQLKARGLLSETVISALFTPERLLWQGDYGHILSLMWVELWLQRWTDRLSVQRPAPDRRRL